MPETLYEQNTRYLKVAAQKAADAERAAKRLADLLHSLCRASHEQMVLPTAKQMREVTDTADSIADAMSEVESAGWRVEREDE